MAGTIRAARPDVLPGWVPDAARHYLHHTEQGLSIREVARAEGCHASTILRRIRRTEQRRDDPLVDEALDLLGQAHFSPNTSQESPSMTAQFAPTSLISDEETVNREARRVLRRMAEPGAVLGVAPDMEKAAVLRETPDGRTTRTAVVDRPVAHAFALKDWISCQSNGRVARYTITQAGRSALKELLAEDSAARRTQARNANPGFAEAQTPFGAPATPVAIPGDWDDEDEKPRRVRYNLVESPVMALSRRRDGDGAPFLNPDLVAAAERLREDFELANMGSRAERNWEDALTQTAEAGEAAPGMGAAYAGDRVVAALRELGPGLGDMVLRCCCYLEGLEATEKRMGWSARSGKIVLRIALLRLQRHYEETYGDSRNMIG